MWQRLDRHVSLTCVGLHWDLPTPVRGPHPAPVQQHPGPCTGLLHPSLKGLEKANHSQTCPILTGHLYFCFSSFFTTQEPQNFLGRRRKKKKIPLPSCTALPQWSPLRPTKKEDKLWMFICQFYFPPICFSLVCKPRNGERRWDANTFFLQLLQSLSSRPTVVCDPHNDQTCTAPW